MSESSINTDKTYVYDGVEVKQTGRTAKKETRNKSKRVVSREVLIYEIAPADREMGNWKKWVRKEELFEIIE